MKSSELLKLLKTNGWFEIRQSGSHIIMAHSDKDFSITVPYHGSNEVKKGLLRAILKKCNIKTTKR
jgi:predicted RNA binding protein YcfA (HicA-like mRNA interferase family)